MNTTGFFIGVDGGGSRCRVRVCDDTGQTLGSAEGGPANVYLDFDAAIATIRSTVDEAWAQAGLGGTAQGRARMGLGLAGVSSPVIAARVGAALHEFGTVTVTNDGVIACLGAHAGADGGLAIAGTGSAAVLRQGKRAINIGGRGFLLGDDGSGAQIGRDAWRRALRAHDGLESSTPLLRALMAEFDDDPVAVIAWGRNATSSHFAAYAPKIAAAALAGDTAALPIFQAAGRSISELIELLFTRGAPHVALTGGLASVLLPYLDPRLARTLRAPIGDALDGALRLAKEPLV